MPRKKKKDSTLALRVGRNIKAARMERSLTQAQLAERVGIEVESMSRIETGAHLPSLERLAEIARILGLRPDTLLFDGHDGQSLDTSLALVLADLPQREREFVYAFAVNYVRHWKDGQA